MKIIDNFIYRRKVDQLKKELEKSPTPEKFIALINKYEEAKETEMALATAQKALDLYSDETEIFNIYSKLRKKDAEKEIKTLKQLITERPNPTAFCQLAEIYKDLREEETALKYCRMCIEKFPKDDGAYLIIGELRLRRFLSELLIKDGVMARDNLEKAFEINRKNYKSLILLSKFYLQIGAIGKAIQRLKSVLVFAPEDETAQTLLDAALKIPKPPHEDIDILLQIVESERKLYYPLKTSPPPLPKVEEVEPEILNSSLKDVNSIEGHQATFICDEEGNLLAHSIQEGKDPNVYYEIATTIYSTAQDSSRKMDLGRLYKGMIDGPFGSIHIVNSNGFTYIMFGGQNGKPEILSQKLESLVSRVNSMVKRGN